jgi:hypothetical protein
MKDLYTTRDLSIVLNGQDELQLFLPAGTRLQAKPDGQNCFAVACKSWFIPVEGTTDAPNIQLHATELSGNDRPSMKRGLAHILEAKHMAALIKEFGISKEDLEAVALKKEI